MFNIRIQLVVFFYFVFIHVFSQSKVWGTYCENGISPYTSRNVFYEDGQYFAVTGLIDEINDTINLKQDINDYSIVKGKWNFTKNKKMIH